MDNKKYTGYGTFQSEKGEYTGEIVENKCQGFGSMKFSNYDIYEGDWLDGKMHGVGKYMFWNEAKDMYTQTYEGQFNNGVREGKGTMKYANRNVYTGFWQNNMRTGEGICVFADGKCFHGIWKFDKMIRGVMCFPDGNKYDGDIKDGKLEGYGKFYWNDGNWFEGIFKEGKPWNGILLTPEGKITEFFDGEMK